MVTSIQTERIETRGRKPLIEGETVQTLPLKGTTEDRKLLDALAGDFGGNKSRLARVLFQLLNEDPETQNKVRARLAE